MELFASFRDAANSITQTAEETNRQMRALAEEAKQIASREAEEAKRRYHLEETERQLRVAAEEANKKLGLEETQRQLRIIAEEGERLLRQQTEDAQRSANDMLKSVKETVEDVRKNLQKLVPSFGVHRQQIVDKLIEIASSAAAEGLDIIEAINSAVGIAFQEVERTFQKAIDTVNDTLQKAQDIIFHILDEVVPDGFRYMLDSVKTESQSVLAQLRLLGEQIKNEICEVLKQIQQTVGEYVRKVDEILGPISKFIKCLWRELFGNEPEQCHIAAQWFEERIRRTEKQLLYRQSAEPISILVKKHTFLEVLPPDEQSWKALVLEFLDQAQGMPAWEACREKFLPLLETTTVKPGNVTQLTWDKPFTDALGGNQRISISVHYFRWKSEEFRMVSSGFLGILAMVSAVGPPSKPNPELPSTQVGKEPPLLLDSAARKMIYEQIKPHIRIRPLARFEGPEQRTEIKNGESRQLKYRDNDGFWISAI